MDNEENKDDLKSRIAELESQVIGLEKDLIHDNLTGLKTRAFFEEESKVYLDMVRNVESGKRKRWFGFKHVSFLFFDIDHFKNVNDTYGHDIGDEVLKKVAEAIHQSVRVGDTVARWGGEEMVASLLGADVSDAKLKAEDIRNRIEELEFDNPKDLKVTISIGVVSSDEGSDFDDLMKKVDKALYNSKESGRNRVTAFTEI